VPSANSPRTLDARPVLREFFRGGIDIAAGPQKCNRSIELHNPIDGRCNRQFPSAINTLLQLRKTSKNERTNLSGEEKENS